MDKTGKVTLAYIIVMVSVLAVIAGYRYLNKSNTAGNSNSNSSSVAVSGVESNDKSTDDADGRTMANLRLAYLKQCFINPYHVKKYYDKLVEDGVIERYEYTTGENSIVLIYEKSKMQEFTDYSKKVLDDAVKAEYDKYYFEMSDDYSILTAYVYPDSDGAAFYRDAGRIFYYAHTYVYSTLAEDYKLHMVIKRADTEETIGEVDMPGGNASIPVEKWTGIDDRTEAENMMNSNMYSYVNYAFPNITEDKFYSNVGGFCFTIPEGAEFTTDEVNNKVNEMEDSTDILAVKKKLSTEKAYMEANLVFDESTYVLFSANYLEDIDDSNFLEYINDVYCLDLENRDDVTIEDVAEIQLLGRDAVKINYVAGDKNCRLICFYRNGLSYYILGSYKDSESEKVIDDFLLSLEKN